MPSEAEVGIMATTQNLFTYLVDEDGYINFPVLGRVHLAGLTINESIRMMERLIQEYAPQAVVSVQVANFKVGIFGEVKKANVFTIKTPRVSILDLIAMAGDLTILADRKNVWVHRDQNGKKEHARLELTDPAIFASPYYYLQQNDMVYVMPNKAQKRNSKFSESDNMIITMCTVIISSISLVITAIMEIRGKK
jgi:polysaccharide export outer membrane protein